MPPKLPGDPVDRYVRALARDNNPGALTGTQVKAGAASSSRPRRLTSRPDCALCGKPVEDFTEEEGFLDKFVMFTARCHGETQRVRVELESIKDGRIDFGLAFVPENRLAPPAEQKSLPPVAPPGMVACPGCGHLTPETDAPPGYRLAGILSCGRCGYGKTGRRR